MAFLYILSCIRIVLTILRPFLYGVFDFIGRMVFGEKETLPPICNEILLMSATELAYRIRKRMLTATDVMQAYINRVEEINSIINACVDERFDEALADAQAVDVMMKSEKWTEEQLVKEMPLLGVPFTCKEVIGVKGMTQSNGLLIFKDRKAPLDAESVMEYRKAGAIPFIVTNVPTMSMMWETSNLIFGRTINPYDKRRTCGGSSGGEAAMLASAGAVIGLGTDCGGSIRIPSAFCGIYGHKSSRGIVSNKQPWPNSENNYDPFTSTGPMCRYVQDLKMLLRVMSGSDAEKLNLDEKVDFTKIKLFYMEELPGYLLSATSDIKAAIRKVLMYVAEFIRLIWTITRPLTYILFDIIGRIILGRTEPLPPVHNKILVMSATELADNIRKRKLRAEDVMQAFINRVKEVNPIINACVDERFEEALSDARAVDEMLEKRSMTEQQLATEFPLLGVPFSCKEMIGVQGLAQTNGLLLFKDRKSPSDAAVVMMYKKAGAIPYVVTNVPTFSMTWETSNLVFGRTMNPFDKRRTPGGSSGGEAALLTSAGAVIGIGTDIGGSIRIPSAFCGIYGHKPSRGIISNQKPWPDTNPNYAHLRSTGPMCRYVQDLKMLMRISSAEDAARLNLDEKVDFAKVKIYYMEELPGIALSAIPDVKAAVLKAANYFKEKFGSSPMKLILKEMKDAADICQCKFIEADGPPMKSMQKNVKINWYWELLKCFFGRAQFDFQVVCLAMVEKNNKDKMYYKFLQLYEVLKNKLEDTLSGDAILIMPTHPEPAPHIYTPIIKFKNVGYTCLFNCFGYPATNIPAGMSYGMPVGLQIVATQNKDRLTLAAAEELDKIFFGWKSPCEISIKN